MRSAELAHSYLGPLMTRGTYSALQAASKPEAARVVWDPGADVLARQDSEGSCSAIVVWKGRAKEGCTAEISLSDGPWIVKRACATQSIELALAVIGPNPCRWARWAGTPDLGQRS